MSKNAETPKQDVVQGLTAEQLAAERESPNAPGADTVVVNQQTLQAGTPPSLNYPASDAYVASITPQAVDETEKAPAAKSGKDWWVDGSGEAWRRDQIVGVSIPKNGKIPATDRIALRLATGSVVHAPVADPVAARDELLK